MLYNLSSIQQFVINSNLVIYNSAVFVQVSYNKPTLLHKDAFTFTSNGLKKSNSVSVLKHKCAMVVKWFVCRTS